MRPPVLEVVDPRLEPDEPDGPDGPDDPEELDEPEEDEELPPFPPPPCPPPPPLRLNRSPDAVARSSKADDKARACIVVMKVRKRRSA